MFREDGAAGRLPLARHEILRSRDQERVQQVTSRVFKPHKLEVLDRPAGLDARMSSVRLRDMSVSVVSYGGSVRIDAGRLDDFFAVLIPLAGEAEIHCGDGWVRYGTGRARVVSPGDQVCLRWPADCVQLVVRVDCESLHARLSDLVGAPVRGELRFAPLLELDSGYGHSWRRGLELLVSELDRPGSLIEQHAAADVFERALITGLLVGHPSNYTSMLRGDIPAAPSRAVSVALEWMENHPKWQHTTASLAREAFVSERSLQLGFRKHLNMGPMEYLREVRMRRVHDQLRAAQADTVTVTEVAAAWGFLHTGHFAARYQRRFGERPSDTLRR